MTQAIPKQMAAVFISFLFFMTGIFPFICFDSEPGSIQSSDAGQAIETSKEGVSCAPRITSLAKETKLNINTGTGTEAALSERPVAILMSLTKDDTNYKGAQPMGDPGSGWTYDILISDQAWNMNSDGFQSMETDPTNLNDLYVVYECWTNYATGTFQWCLAVRRSTNGGETWSSEIWVFAFPSQINGVYPDMKEPDLAIGNDGRIWITYTIFAYGGPSRNVVDMQIDAQALYNYNWATGPWSAYIVSDDFGSPYRFHRLPSIAIHQTSNKPVIATLTYDAISATLTSLVAWQWYDVPTTQPWDGWLVIDQESANYIQHPCIDAGSSGRFYIASMYYYEAGGVFDMIVNRSTDGGMTWTLVGDFYDAGNVYSFYKPSIASTKSGTDIVVCAGTWTSNPSDQHIGQIGYAFSLDSGTNWDGYIITMSNYQRMPYVQEDFSKSFFMLTYRQEDGGPAYSTMIMYADVTDLTTWTDLNVVSDTGSFQASNWFAHVALQSRPDGGDYPCVCWSDLRDAAAPITEISDTYVVYSTMGGRYTIDTDPTGLEIYVDTQFYTMPVIFNWPAGYEHYVEAPSPQYGGGGETYIWDTWSDMGTQEHSFPVFATDDTITAYYMEIIQFSIPLREGWNLISLPLAQTDTDINTVLQNIAGLWDYVMVYDSADPDHWKTNSIYRPSQLNDLSNFDHRIGIWIHITQSGVSFDVEGYQPASTTIPLYAGWNLVSYPSLTQTSIVSALAGTGYDMAEGYDGNDPYRTSVLPGSYMMRPGEGYWVHVPADTNWVVNW